VKQAKTHISVRAKNGRGRPSKFNEEYTTRLAGWLARDGLTNEEICREMGISTSTLHEWCKKYPQLASAIKKGKDYVDREVEDSLLRRALGYEYEKEELEVTTTDTVKGDRVFSKRKTTTMHVPPDVVAIIYWLGNRKPAVWKNRRMETDFEHQKGDISDLFKSWKENPPSLDSAKSLSLPKTASPVTFAVEHQSEK